jgi:hypothetical protein
VILVSGAGLRLVVGDSAQAAYDQPRRPRSRGAPSCVLGRRAGFPEGDLAGFAVSNAPSLGALSLHLVVRLASCGESAIIGFGYMVDMSLVEAPWSSRRGVQISLSFDHRVCDTDAASGFLSRALPHESARPTPLRASVPACRSSRRRSTQHRLQACLFSGRIQAVGHSAVAGQGIPRSRSELIGAGPASAKRPCGDRGFPCRRQCYRSRRRWEVPWMAGPKRSDETGTGWGPASMWTGSGSDARSMKRAGASESAFRLGPLPAMSGNPLQDRRPVIVAQVERVLLPHHNQRIHRALGLAVAQTKCGEADTVGGAVRAAPLSPRAADARRQASAAASPPDPGSGT